ncbi:uncharacterized protein LOC141910963 [Tubulanus polymorphus]|uniref:uncharacterized protein LOC141910963 n=1 Tax=Tubulanus polymorphus TaxID=672921 RepID=UPI003DA66E1C
MASLVQPVFHQADVVLPGLKSKKTQNSTKLLRKPRPPPPPVRKKPAEQDPEDDDPDRFDKQESSLFDPDEYNLRWTPLPTTPSVVPSLASPVPAELAKSRKSPLKRRGKSGSSPQRVNSYLRNQQKYILEALYRHNTSEYRIVPSSSSTAPGSLVKSYKPRGPDAFPMRMPKILPHLMNQYLFLEEQDDLRYYEPCLFTLNDFLIRVSQIQRLPLRKVKKAVFSKHNYKKLTKLLAQEYLERDTGPMTVVSMDEQLDMIDPVQPRIPGRQVLIEMAALVKSQMEEVLQYEVKSSIRALPKYQSPFKPGETPHTEIVIYDGSKSGGSPQKLVSFVGGESVPSFSQSPRPVTMSEFPEMESVFQSSTPHFFQESRRSNSPFAATGDREVSPSELAVLDSIVSGGTALSLKANFINQLPDIVTLSKTITYLNLSFNDFRFVPPEVLSIKQLQVLKLRDNPIKDIPSKIHCLKKLKTLVMSFCLISSLPPGLFLMKRLRHLDLSYNRISFIPNDIKQLKTLRELNVDGNQLPALPCGALKLNLKYIRVANNYMHPLFWEENTRNQPVRLVDIAANIFIGYQLQKRYSSIHESALQVLKNPRRCDCCKGAMYGPGIRLIRPCTKIFGVKNVPFLFNSCSPQCADMFRWNTDMDQLYASSDSETEADQIDF